MSGIPTNLWPIDPHSAAKHDILRRYLQAWLPILGKHNQRVQFIDGFAGPGLYKNGEPGSPVVALETCANHSLRPTCSTGFTFIEAKKARASHLRGVLAERFPLGSLPENWSYKVSDGKCAPLLSAAMDELDELQQNLAPTLAFLDPFGYSDVPMELVARILNHPRCEVIITFMAGFAARFTDATHRDAQNTLFGTDEWKRVDQFTGMDARCSFLVDLYQRQIQNVAKARYVRSFEMRDQNNRIIYYLVYATNHVRGMAVMKHAMWTVDPRGTFRFSDRTARGQTFIVQYEGSNKHWGPAAARMVHQQFAGQSVPVEEIEEWVITETPYLFQKRAILVTAEKAGYVQAVQGRQRAGTFPPKCVVEFKPVAQSTLLP